LPTRSETASDGSITTTAFSGDPPPIAVDAEHPVHRLARERRAVRLVHRLDHYRYRRQLAEPVGAGQQPITKIGFAARELLRLGAQHQMRKIDVPRMRRHIRTLGHVAEVAQIALVDDLAEVRLVDAVDFAGLALVDQVEQRGERIAEAHAAAAAVADVEDPLELFFGRRCVVVIRILPVDRMPDRSFEAAFALGHRRLSGSPR